MQQEQQKNLLTVTELSEYLNIKEKTIYAKVKAGGIPCYRFGSLIRFHLNEVDECLKNCRNNYKPEVNQPKGKKNRKKSPKLSDNHVDKIIRNIIDEVTSKDYHNVKGNQTGSRPMRRKIMGLYERNGIWWMCFTHAGRQLRRSTETKDYRLAQRIFDKLKGEIAEGKWFERLPAKDYTFSELMDKYMTEYSEVNKRPSSIRREKYIIKNLKGFFGKERLTDISRNNISEYKVLRREQKASSRTINHELAIMSHAFNLAIKNWEWIKENPIKDVSREKVLNTIERWLTAEEQGNLIKASPPWLQDIIVFAVNTGLRQSEILDLKWQQVDLSRKTVTIFEQKNQDVDTLPLNKNALAVLLKREKMIADKSEYVFPNVLNKRKGNRELITAFHKALKKAQIKEFRFHDLRHTFATRLVQKGVDLYTVQKLGRWKTISMVTRYGHHNIESLRKGIKRIDSKGGKVITILSQRPENEKRLVTLPVANP